MGLGLGRDQAPLLGMGTELGTKAFLWGGGRGLVGLTVEDQAGRKRLTLALREDGTADVGLLDETGQPVWQAR